MSEIKPAMTEEDMREWAAWLALDPAERKRRLRHAIDEVDADGYSDPRLLAAKALNGQPFGFTWGDVDREWATCEYAAFPEGESQLRACGACDHCKMVHRIAALLPPREPSA